MAKPAKSPSRRFVLVLTAVFVLISIYPVYVALEARRLMSASEPSTCEILAKGVDSSEDADGSTNGYYPTVEIAHEVDGQRYVRQDSGRRFITESDARQSTAALTVGDRVECRYVAGSPAEVIVLEQDDGQVRGMAVFAILLWVMPLGLFLWARTQPGWREGSGESKQ